MVCEQLLLAYSKGYALYIRLTYGKHMLYNIIILESSSFFYVLHNCVTMTVIYVTNMWHYANSIPKFSNKKINEN